MKKFIVLAALAFAAIGSPASAASSSFKGTVTFLKVSSSTTTAVQVQVLPLVTSPLPSTGTCQQPSNNNRIFVMPNTTQGDRMRQLLSAALLAGKAVTVYWNDTQVDANSGYCLVQAVGLSST